VGRTLLSAAVDLIVQGSGALVRPSQASPVAAAESATPRARGFSDVQDGSNPAKSQTVTRSDGVTPSERYLKRLCDRSFLSLWSYPGIFRDQGRPGGEGDGKGSS
jgi:hypothetical protein